MFNVHIICKFMIIMLITNLTLFPSFRFCCSLSTSSSSLWSWSSSSSSSSWPSPLSSSDSYDNQWLLRSHRETWKTQCWPVWRHIQFTTNQRKRGLSRCTTRFMRRQHHSNWSFQLESVVAQLHSTFHPYTFTHPFIHIYIKPSIHSSMHPSIYLFIRMPSI